MTTDALLPIVAADALDGAARRELLARPASEDRAEIVALVRETVRTVRTGGDAAVIDYARRFDGGAPDRLRVPPQELDAALAALPSADRAALERAITNVRAFHAAQLPAPLSLETMPGVRCERITRPLDSVGLYVPGGSAPLPSALIMSAIPAALAGVRRRVLCTPARGGRVHPAILATARLCGVDEVFAVGGAQAIAALAYGTETIPKVDKIVGPGSAWVTAAKQVVAEDPQGAALDLPAGPSEVLVIADDSARAEFVAADLLAQAEHDEDAQSILITDSAAFAHSVAEAVDSLLQQLGRAAIAGRSWAAHGGIVVVRSLDEAPAIANRIAPEHLQLCTADAGALAAQIRHAGAIFLGATTPEAIGDYVGGPNHVLPTSGSARFSSGLSVLDFMKRTTILSTPAAALEAIGPAAALLADAEGLGAHALSVRMRLKP